jgi:hypothetical protein
MRIDTRQILWAVTEECHVTLIAHSHIGTSVLVERVVATGAVYRYNLDAVRAFVLSGKNDSGTWPMYVNGVVTDVGQYDHEFRTLLSEAAHVAAPGQTYLTDPEAGRGAMPPDDSTMIQAYDAMEDADRQWQVVKNLLDVAITLHSQKQDHDQDVGFLREAQDLFPGLLGNLANLMASVRDILIDADTQNPERAASPAPDPLG